MNIFVKILFAVLSVVYPLVVFLCLVIFKVPVKVFSLFIIFIAFLYLLFATGGDKKMNLACRLKKNLRLLVSATLLMGAALFCLATGKDFFIKLYPVLMNAVFLFAFGSTLFAGPVIIFRFACLADKSLAKSMIAGRVERYCRKVTLVWCAFFILNGSAALYTVFIQNDKIWSLYNGGISYLLMGLLFAFEYIVRRVVNSKMPKIIPLSKFNAGSRPLDTVLCFEGKWSQKKFLTWNDFLTDCAKMRNFINQFPQTDKWILHCDDYWYFLCTLVALLQCKKEALITANISPNYIAEIRSVPEDIRFLSDKKSVEGMELTGFDFIPDVIENSNEVSEEEKMTTPEIIADESRIVLYTSGSTGHPKAVLQRLTEFEADNAFVSSKWGEEFLSRKLVSTVSQHHIYGFLFTTTLPFSLAVPVRRTRIEFPEEFETLDDEKYMIIAVPAFLKRTNMEREGKKLNLKQPWIFTSGGVLLPEVAEQTDKVFGFWPMEVYGSTETSGIAWRQSKDGLAWTPFDNAKIWQNEEGCLTIISPYIKDPAGFATGDLVEIHSDGRFLLKGRADSIVKIEEKRISVVEVENRIMSTGLVADCCVVPMSDRRQYLAAAIVLNKEGKEKFASTEKYLVNRYFHDYLLEFFENVVLPKKWRYLESMPLDPQGKKKKPVIQKLFALENPHGIPAETLMSRKENNSIVEVELEVNIPASSDYFDGHFPQFKLLPAVAQIDMVAHFAHRYFGTELSARDIKRFKFSNKILPDSVVIFKLKYDGEKNRLYFELSDFSANTVYASGSYCVLKQNEEKEA